jgi:hypothetical protein
MDDKRQLTKDGTIMRIKFLKKQLHIPQFIITWNSLHKRSTTRPGDHLILFANPLNFNVYSLEALSIYEKLPSLIQSCDGLPLSLLYNTGTRLHIDSHPELGWVPRDISDVKLAGDTVIRRVFHWCCKGRVSYKIDQANSDPDSIMFLKATSTYLIPCTVNFFAIRRQGNGDNHIDPEYYVEVQRSDAGGPDSDVAHRIAQAKYSQSQGTFIVIESILWERIQQRLLQEGVHASVSR